MADNKPVAAAATPPSKRLAVVRSVLEWYSVTTANTKAAPGNTQAVSYQHGHIDGIETRQRLTDGQAGHELVVVEPGFFFGQQDLFIGNDAAAKANSANDQELVKKFEQRRLDLNL